MPNLITDSFLLLLDQERTKRVQEPQFWLSEERKKNPTVSEMSHSVKTHLGFVALGNLLRCGRT